MKLRGWATLGAGVVGLGSVGVATPTFAAPVPGCGDEPAGGSLTESGGVCTLVFDTPGSYDWTLPPGISGLNALVVGGGGGTRAFTDGGYAWGGHAGKVRYVDLTAQTAGQTLTATVGAGSASYLSSTWEFDPVPAAEDSAISVGPSGPSLATADGAPEGPGEDECTLGTNADGWAMFTTGVGDGAGGAAIDDANAQCADNVGPGVTPSAGDVDSYGNTVPTALSVLTDTYAAGGLPVKGTVLPQQTAGSGANTVWSQNTAPGGGGAGYEDGNTTGANGAVIYVWDASESSQAPEITTQPSGGQLSNGVWTLNAAATGDPSPTVQWQYSEGPNGPWVNIEGATETSFDATKPGFYRAVFSNSEGTATTSVVEVTAPKLADTGTETDARPFALGALALLAAGGLLARRRRS